MHCIKDGRIKRAASSSTIVIRDHRSNVSFQDDLKPPGVATRVPAAEGVAGEDDRRYRAALPVMMVVMATAAPNPRFLDAVNRLLSLDLSMNSLHVCVIAIASGLLFLTASPIRKANKGSTSNTDEYTIQSVPSVQFMVEEPMSLAARISQSNRAAISRVSSAAQMAKVSSAASFARISEAVMHISVSNLCFKGFSPQDVPRHAPTISASECFVSVEAIAALTLEDVSTIIRYAIQSNRADFEEDSFYVHLNPYMRRVISDLDEAAMESRGMEALPSRLSGLTQPGDVDALMFLAAMRIFVEWRIVRQVPEGFKAYAVGLSLAKRDLVQNAAKMEAAVHAWIDMQRQRVGVEGEVYSPTLRQLLQFELETNVHSRLPRLKDHSAAIGLLWVKRQVQYQTLIYENLLHVPHSMSAVEAVRTAYEEVFGSYHGWLIQKTFNYSFSGTPPVEAIYKMMNPRHFRQVMNNLNNPYMSKYLSIEMVTDHGTADTIQTSVSNQSSFDEVSDESFDNCDEPQGCDIKQVSKDEGVNILHLGHHLESEWRKFTKNIQNVWEDLLSKLDPKTKKIYIQESAEVTPPEANTSSLVSSADMTMLQTMITSNATKALETSLASMPTSVLEGEALETYINKEMTKAAHSHIGAYLETIQPLLNDLTAIFLEFNMDDPTRV